MFADDCALADQYTCLHEAESRLNRDLNTIADWSRKWYVTFNVEKTVLINFSLKKTRSLPRIIFNNIPVRHVDEHRHLGMTLTYNLNWSKHIRCITTKASQKIGVLRRQYCKFSRSQLERIYLGMIRPTLEHGNVIFDNCSVSSSLLLESIQRRAVVICTGAMRRTEALKLERETGWESLSLRRERAKLCWFFSFCNVGAPSYLQGKIIFAPESSRITRSSSNNGRRVLEKTCRLECFRKSFFPDCAARWNALPQELRVMNSCSQFKVELARHIATRTNNLALNVSDCSCYSKICYGKTGRLITQFRLGLSPLRSDLFIYNIIDNPFCPSCGDTLETLKHFFLECPAYRLVRVTLIDDLVGSLNSVRCYLPDLNMQCVDVLLAIITRGAPLNINNPDLPVVNKIIFACISRYINQTKRFQVRLE